MLAVFVEIHWIGNVGKGRRRRDTAYVRCVHQAGNFSIGAAWTDAAQMQTSANQSVRISRLRFRARVSGAAASRQDIGQDTQRLGRLRGGEIGRRPRFLTLR